MTSNFVANMIDLERVIEEALAGSSVSPERFREIVLRLLDNSVIARTDSQTEEALYDDALRVIELLVSYFAVMGSRLVHDSQFRYLQLYAPGASIPGISTETNEGAGLRLRLSQHEVAVALVLRFLYDRALQAGALDDEGRASVSLEELQTAMKSVLDRSLPEASTERRGILRRLKQLKLIDYRPDVTLEDADSVIVIRPLIIGFVHADNIQAAGDALPESDESAMEVQADGGNGADR